MKEKFILIFVLIVSWGGLNAKDDKHLTYFFDKPAQVWEETLPLGNGRIGLMPDGGIFKDSIILNEHSLWSGSKQDTANPLASRSLGEIQQLLFQNKNKEAQELMYQTFVCKGLGSNLAKGRNIPYGSYQLLGNLVISYQYNTKDTLVSDYERSLDISNAISKTSFTKQNTKYTREYFTSFSNDVGVIRLKAEGSEKLNLTISMNRPERFNTSVVGNDLCMTGFMNDGLEGKGVEYAAKVRVLLPKEGKIEEYSLEEISVIDADEVLLLVAMRTDFYGDNPFEKTLEDLEFAEQETFSKLYAEHLKVFSEKFDRVELNIGSDSEKENLPINERLASYVKDKNDPSLLSLYFQFGRYLLISSTRVGLLPSNLQGLWCNTLDTPWNGDFHLNINFQMNHWPVEVGNLSELHQPMIEWTKQQVESGEQTAKAFYNASGWVTHILGNVWEFTAPGEHPSWGATNTSAAWLCQHLYTHYEYSGDKEYLKSVYPTMKGAAQFFVDMLVEDPRTGYLITAPTTSPEHAYKTKDGDVVAVSAGSTMDNQIVRELFSNVVKSAKILNQDKDFSQILIAKRDSLMPTSIGDDGRVMEWLDKTYTDTETTHRHVSHLYGLYPGNEISVNQTPTLAEAAKKTLEVRGDGGTGWSMGWKVNFWARLHDGNRALTLLGNLLKPASTSNNDTGFYGGTYPNLFCAHPPFQIDGNLGGCAGIAEMLLQSQEEVIELLPALPDSWKEGCVKGLKARGNFIVDIHWEDNSPQSLKIKSANGGKCVVLSKVPLIMKTKRAKMQSNKDDKGNYLISFETKKNQTYSLESL